MTHLDNIINMSSASNRPDVSLKWLIIGCKRCTDVHRSARELGQYIPVLCVDNADTEQEALEKFESLRPICDVVELYRPDKSIMVYHNTAMFYGFKNIVSKGDNNAG